MTGQAPLDDFPFKQTLTARFFPGRSCHINFLFVPLRFLPGSCQGYFEKELGGQMSCFHGGMDAGSGGCRSSEGKGGPAPGPRPVGPRAARQPDTPGWTEPQPQPQAATPTQRRGDCHVMLAGLPGGGPFLPVNVQPCGRKGTSPSGVQVESSGTPSLCASPYFRSILSHRVSPRLTPRCDWN